MVHKWHTDIPLGKFKRKMSIPSMLAAAGNAGCVHRGLGKGGTRQSHPKHRNSMGLKGLKLIMLVDMCSKVQAFR